MKRNACLQIMLFGLLGLGAWGVGTPIPAAAAPAAGTEAGDLRATGRRIAKEDGSAIVTVRLVISHKMAYEGEQTREGEEKSEVSGTVVSPEGLTIVPLSEIDPASAFRRMAGSQAEKITYDTRVKDIKLVVDKTKEIPATVVLRDNELDIAFLRPQTKPKTPMKYVNLANSATPELLQQVCVLARMGKVADQEVGVMTGEIQAIVKKPRTFYVPSAELASGGYGVPIFAADGKVVGIVLMRTLPGAAAQESGEGGNLAIILPTADVQEIAAQAAENPPEALAPPAKSESKPTTKAAPAKAAPSAQK